MTRSRRRALIALSLAACSAAPAYAETLAYWRHEEGTNGGFIAAGADSVLDSSGQGNHMRTFDPVFTSATYTNDVPPLPLRSGQPNNLALRFGPGGDEDRARGGRDDDNYTQGKNINLELFPALTVELAFKSNTVDGWQALFGKDGKPLGDEVGEDDSPVPPLKFLVRNDDFPGGVPNQLFVEFVDGDGKLNSDVHFVNSGFSVVPNQWYHVAFTLTATTAELWIAGASGPYQLIDSITGDFVGAADEVLVFEPLGFTAGRGMFNNGITDWADATIDEIRISNTALTPNQFVFLPNVIPGDANMNGVIDGDDFAAIDRGAAMGLTGYANGDFNNDNVINAADYAIINSSFAAQGGSAPAFAVPEPASMAAAGLATLALFGRRRRA